MFSVSFNYAQNEDLSTDEVSSELYYFNPEINSSLSSYPSLSAKDKFRTGISMGSSFTNLYGTNFLSSYMAPHVSYDVDTRLRLTVGTMMTYTSFNSSQSAWNEHTQSYGEKMAQYYMFARGEYRLSKNINIRAATIFEVNPATQQNRTSIHNIGFDFRITDNAFIHADFNFGNYNFYDSYNPFYGGINRFDRRPFGYSPFYY